MIARAARLLPETRAVLLMILAVIAFSTMDAIGKGLTQRMDALQVVWARYASQTFWTLLLLAPRIRTHLVTRHPGLQLARSGLLFAATLGFFVSFSVMPLAATAAIFQVAPLFITLLGFLLLHETVGPRRWIGVGAGLVGALLIIRPGSEVFSPYALLALLGALANAGYAITTRVLGRDEGPWTNFAYATLLGTLVASLAVPFFWTTPDRSDAVTMALFGLLGGAGHILLIFGLRIAPASALAPYGYLSVVFAALWGYVFFAEVPDVWTFAGALVIVGAGLYVWHRERRARLQPA